MRTREVVKFRGDVFQVKQGPKAQETVATASPTADELERVAQTLKPGDNVLRVSKLEYVVVRR